METLHTQLEAQLSPYLGAPCWWVAYSGGLDSSVLLHAVASLRDSLQRSNNTAPVVRAVHVNHHLSPNADGWQQHCLEQTRRLNISCDVIDVAIEGAASIEQQARDARYNAFSKLLGKGDILLTGQHQADQAETLFYRLLRGSGVQGLAAMPVVRTLGDGRLVRPLLKVPKTSLEQYAKQHTLSFVDDESNADQRFDRNFLRTSVLPLLKQRWPKAEASMARAAQHMAEASQLLFEFARQDIEYCQASIINPRMFVDDDVAVVSCSALLSLSVPRRKNLLRAVMLQHEIVPSAKQLTVLLEQCVAAQQDATPCLDLCGHRWLRYLDFLMFTPIRPLEISHYMADGDSERLAIPLGATWCKPAQSTRFKPSWRQHSTTLKKLFQACKIPAEHRAELPVLMLDGECLAVPGVGLSDSLKTASAAVGLNVKVSLNGCNYLCDF